VEKYDIVIKKSALKELIKIPKKDLKKIILKIKSLSINLRPIGCEKCTGIDRYRIRQGYYRILYTIKEQILTVYVVKIGHRKDIYRYD